MKKRPKASLMLYVVDDATFVRELIFDSLIKKPDSSSVSLQFNVEGEATLAQEFLDQVEDLQANLFLIDTDLPDASGWSVVQAIKDLHPDAYIVMMCDGLNPKAAEKYADSQALAFRVLEKPFQPSYFWRILDEIGLAMTEETTAEEPKRRGLFKKKPTPEVVIESAPAVSHKVQHHVSDWTPPAKLERAPAAPTFVTQTLQQAVETRLVQPIPTPSPATAEAGDIPAVSVAPVVPAVSVPPVIPVATPSVKPADRTPQTTPRKVNPPSFATQFPPVPPRNRKKPVDVAPVEEPILPKPDESFVLVEESFTLEHESEPSDNLTPVEPSPLPVMEALSKVENLPPHDEAASETALVPVMEVPTAAPAEKSRTKPIFILDEIPRDLNPAPKADVLLPAKELPIIESSPIVVTSEAFPHVSHPVETNDSDLVVSPDSWVQFEEEDEDEDWIFNTPLAESQSETPAKAMEVTPTHPPLTPKAPETPIPVPAPDWNEPDLVMPMPEPTLEGEAESIDEQTLPVTPAVNEWPVFDSLPGFVPPAEPEPETRPGFIPPMEDLNFFLDSDVFVLEDEDEEEDENEGNTSTLSSPDDSLSWELSPTDYLDESPRRPDANFEYQPHPLAYDKGTKPLDVDSILPPALDGVEKPLIIAPLASNRRPKPSAVAHAASPEALAPAPSKRKGFGKKNN